MKYYVTVNKRFRYVKVYGILKRPHENTNKISKYFSAWLDRMISKQKKEQ